MANRKQRVNPFYIVLVVVGVAFAVTACAYGVMAVKQMHASEWIVTPARQDTSDLGAPSTNSDRRFVEFMDEHGVSILLAEVGILALATVAAIGTDDWWSKSKET